MCKVIFFGSSNHSVIVLSQLIKLNSLQIIACVTQKDKPVGRKQILTPTPVSLFCLKYKIPLIKPQTHPKIPWLFLNPEVLTEKIAFLKPDLLIVADYGQKIPLEIIKIARFGGINIHPSLLPKYQGAAPAQWAILNGEKETGVTILTLDKNFDQGKILAWEKELIKDSDTSEDLYQRLFEKGANLLIKILPDFLNGKISPINQESLTSKKPSAAPRLKKEDGKINWKKSPNYIERMVRAFSPWPGTWTFVKIKNQESKTKKLRLKILKAHLEGEKLIFDLVQLEGKKPVTFKQFQQAYPNYEFF